MPSSVQFVRLIAAAAAIAVINFHPDPAFTSETMRVAQTKLKAPEPVGELKHSTRKSNKLQSQTPCVKDENGKLICPPKL